MASLKQLRINRGQVKRNLTTLSEYLKTINQDNITETQINNVIARLERLEPNFDTFNDIQIAIEAATADDEAQQIIEIAERDDFELKFYETIALARTLTTKKAGTEIAGSEASSQATSRRQSTSAMNIQMRLPKLELQTFNGEFTKWRSFYDYFKSIIHTNNSLTNAEKLNYLKSCLRGEPSQLISTLETCDENYEIAVDILFKRYENKRRIINNHVSNILNVNNITKEINNLRDFINTIQSEINCLRSLKVPVDQWDSLLIPILVNKLDQHMVREWENKISAHQDHAFLPSLDDLITFLNCKLDAHESLAQRCSTNHKSYQRERKTVKTFAVTKITCNYCTRTGHTISGCEEFKQLTIEEKNKTVRDKKLCINCLRSNHILSECKSKTSCRTCQRKHHTTLHINNHTLNSQSTSRPTTSNDPFSQETFNCTATAQQSKQVLLSTARVEVWDGNGQRRQARVLLDSASQSHFITEELCQRLKLRKIPVKTKIRGLGQTTTSTNYQTQICIKSNANNFTITLNCLVVPSIVSSLPNVTFDKELIDIPNNLKLADPRFYESSQVDILIGAEEFYSLLCIGQFKQRDITFQKTRFGWILSGNTLSEQSFNETFSYVTIQELHESVERFWNVDEFNKHSKAILTEDEECCEKYFEETTTIAEDGKLCVRIPFKQSPEVLGDSFQTAKKRLQFLEKRFQRNPDLKLKYAEFMQEYQDLGHMTLCEDNDFNNSYFLPHHCVLKDSSTTTKLRVVFDGSSKTSNDLSLNDIQLSGPNLQNEIFSIILRFRTYEYVLIGDIEKMYRAIWIHKDDRRYQKIIWRNNPEEDYKVYELNTITYGTASAPYLAIRSLRYIAEQYVNQFPREAQIISEDFYMDDLITGSNNLDELLNIKNNITHLLSTFGLHLRKFKSNSTDLCDNNFKTINLNLSDNKTLGINWKCESDEISYSIEAFPRSEKITKRTILAETAKLYDPLGLLAPIILTPKVIIQALWQLRLGWDEAIPQSWHTRWLEFRSELTNINKIVIPRKCLYKNAKHVEIHAFCDASETAYGACIYLRSRENNLSHTTTLIAAKSRVAPVKRVTLPRLELCSAALAAQLMHKITQSLQIDIKQYYFWTDSTITLHWIRSDPHKFKTYVSNRITEIQNLTKMQDWYHVKSNDNPADLISRGTTASNLLNNKLWWHGPTWLANAALIEKSILLPEDGDVEEIITLPCFQYEEILPINRFSSLNKITRITAYCQRFLDNCRKKPNSRTTETIEELSPSELKQALLIVIKQEQKRHFPTELHCLTKHKPINRTSPLLSLTPFLDEMGILRVGGRLTLSQYNFDKRHPILLPKDSHLTNLIIRSEHFRLKHAGAKLLISSIRERYWPISATRTVKKVIKYCTVCQRYNAKPMQQLMGDLPSERLIAMYPFHTTGVDYAGPYLVKSTGRGSKRMKAYICLFICFSTKAIHLELVTDLTTTSFMLTLKRFISRRGKPVNIYSDNATNFRGADKELKELYKFLETSSSSLKSSLNVEGINWKFIPPRSPSFGGIWESNIKSTKYHLRRILNTTPLSYEEFYTLLCEIESLLNSRPLTKLSSDPNDSEILTPSHFLIGRTYTSIPDPDVTDIPINRLKRYQLLCKLRSDFWRKWHVEYIHNLQQRPKWQRLKQQLKIGDLVLVNDESTTPGQWTLGRAIAVHPGPDGIVRVVTVKVNRREVKRTINKLCLFPDIDNMNNDTIK